MKKALIVAVLLSCAAPVLADEKRSDAATRAKTIAPYLDSQTVAVVYLDLDRVNPGAIAEQVVKLTKAEGQQARQLEQAKGQGSQFLASLKGAGVHEAYVVVSLAYLPASSPLLVFPASGGDASAVQGLLEQAHVAEAAAVVGQGVVVGDRKVVERLKSLKPARRPQLARAFAAAGNTAFQAAFVPGDELRRTVSETLPKLPPEVGGGSTKVLTEGLDWAVVGLELPPKLSFQATVQAHDAASARALNELFGRGFTALSQIPQLKNDFPEMVNLLKGAHFRVEDTRLVLTLDERQLVTILTPLVARMHAASERVQLSNDLKQLALSMLNYEAQQGTYPATANFDKQGKPLLSWRVHMLPFLEQEALYKEFHLEEPWDSEHNKKLIARMPKVYAGRNDKLTAEGKTPFLVPVGDATMFPPGREGVKIASVTDGTSNTILTVLADDEHSVVWTKPQDLKLDPKEPQAGLNTFNGKGYLTGFADGSVRFISIGIDKKSLYAAFTRNGGEVANIP